MSSYSNFGKKNNNKGLKAFAIIVSILLVVALVVGLFFIGKTTNGFTEMPTFDDDEVVENPFICDAECCCGDGDCTCSEGECGEDCTCEGGCCGDMTVPEDGSDSDDVGGDINPEEYSIKLTYMDVPRELSDYDSKVITATISPSNADIASAVWSLAVSPSFDGKDGNGQSWSKNSDDSSYLTYTIDENVITSDHQLTCCQTTVSCVSAFGCQYVLSITITDMRGNVVSASCNLDYRSYLDYEVITMTNVGAGAVSYSDGFGSFCVNYSDGSFILSGQSESAVPLDVQHMVYSSTYVFTPEVTETHYTVGSVECSDVFVDPVYTFSLVSDDSLTSTSTSWSSITYSLVGISFGNGEFGGKDRTYFVPYTSSNPWFFLTVSIGSSVLTFNVYPTDYDELYVDLSDVVIDPGSGYIFG